MRASQRPPILLTALVLALLFLLAGCRPATPEPDEGLGPVEPGIQLLYIAGDGSLVLVDLGTPVGVRATRKVLVPGVDCRSTADYFVYDPREPSAPPRPADGRP